MTKQAIHIAILDDDPTIRIALVRLLKAAGMVPRAYATGTELLESVALKCPDCLLLDLQMEAMSGLDVLTYLNQRLIRLPAIVITGKNEEASREACMNAGAVAYLLKPLDAGQLIEEIRKHCGSSEPIALSSSV